ncbi:hypothetical protein BaRGS_00002986 [Batillaria attramentaria]|uniref:XK-related protein n=1 Tax=Batillaria attramentaria TaxID=370345 RepID=A0ABD0M1C4_9CAEN
MLEDVTPVEVEDEDRPQPTDLGDDTVQEDVTPCAEAENGDRPQPANLGEDDIRVMPEGVTPITTTETEVTDDTQTPCLLSCGTWKPCTFAERLWGNIHDKHNDDFTRLDLVMGIVSIILYLLDVGTDAELAVRYFQDKQWIYGGLTTAFIVIAYIVVLILGWGFYHSNDVSRGWWMCRLLLLMLGLSPVIATLECLYYGWRGRTRETDNVKYDGIRKGPINLRLLESFLEAAPQLCFQLYIVVKEKPDDDITAAILRAMAVFSSWANLALTAVVVTKHDSAEDKRGILSYIVYFLWRVCETGGRVLCIAMFASMFEYWVFAILGLHYVAMLVWNLWAEKDRSCGQVFIEVCLGYITVFYMPYHSKSSRYAYFIYYIFFYTENFLMLGLWAGMTSDRDAWFYIPGIVAVIVFFLLHIVMMFLYYKVAHPRAQEIKCCVECDWETILKSLHVF